MRTVPVHLYTAANGRQIRFAVDSDFWLTDLSGEDGLDLDISEQQSSGQTGTTVTGTAVGAKPITATGAILRDLDANEWLLKQLLTPGSRGRWTKITATGTWYLDVLTKHSPDVSGGEHLLNFQFSLYAAYPYWRTAETLTTMLGVLTYALFFYRAPLTLRRIFCAKLLTNLQNVVLGALWMAILNSSGRFSLETWYASASLSAVKNLIMLPVQTALLALLFSALLPPLRRAGLVARQTGRLRL